MWHIQLNFDGFVVLACGLLVHVHAQHAFQWVAKAIQNIVKLYWLPDFIVRAERRFKLVGIGLFRVFACRIGIRHGQDMPKTWPSWVEKASARGNLPDPVDFPFVQV